MDPSNPWAYYNRLIPSGIAQAAAASANDFQHQTLSTATGQPTVAGQASAAASILLQAAHASGASTFNPGAFITPTPVAYESVFNPIFHHATPKPAHFNSVINSQHRQNLLTENLQIKTENTSATAAAANSRQNYNEQTNFYTEQSNSVSPVGNATGGTGTTNTPTNLTTWQQQNSALSKTLQQQQQQQSLSSPNNQFYRQQPQQNVSSYNDANSQSSSNVYSNTNNVTTQKERRPRKPQTTTYHPQNLSQNTASITEKEQTKSAAESSDAHQNSSGSDQQESSSQVNYYTLVDGRLVYTAPESTTNSNSSNANQMQTPGHLYLTNTGEIIIAADNVAAQVKNEQSAGVQHYAISAIKNEVLSPQKQSQQANAQSSSSGSSSSAAAAYSIYNSSINSIGSQQQQQQQQQQNVHYTSDSSASMGSRNLSQQQGNQGAGGSVGYSSVITRATGDQAKVYKTQQQQQSPHHQQQQRSHQQNWWESEGMQVKEASYGALHDLTKNDNSGQQVTAGNILVASDRPIASQVQLIQQQQVQSPQSDDQKVNKPPQKPKKPRKPRKTKAEKSREEILDENEFLINRPVSSQSEEIKSVEQNLPQNIQQQQQQQQQQNGFFDFNNRWNLQQQQQQQQQQQNFSNPQSHQVWPNQPIPQHPNQIPYFNPLQMAANSIPPSHLSSAVAQGTPAQQVTNHYPSMLQNSNLMPLSGSQNTPAPVTAASATQNQQQPETKEDEACNKVVVPNIEEELGFLSDTSASFTVQRKSEPPPPIKLTPNPSINSSADTSGTSATATTAASPAKASLDKLGKPSGVGAGFMSSYLKFLQGERETSPPVVNNRGNRNKTQFGKFGNASNKLLTSPSAATSSTATTTTPSASSSPGTCTSPNKSIQIQSLQIIVPAVTNNDEQQQTSSNQAASVKRKLGNQSGDDEGGGGSSGTVGEGGIGNGISINSNNNNNNNSSRGSSGCGGSNQAKPQLPKKARPQMAMQMASMQNRNQSSPSSSSSSSSVAAANNNNTNTNTSKSNQSTAASYQRYHHHHQNQQSSNDEEDPLNVPPRRETSLRKAKTLGIKEILNKTQQLYDLDEPNEFTDSDTDPVWTPEDEESDHGKSGRPSAKKKKSIFSTNAGRIRNTFNSSNILSDAIFCAGIDSEDEIEISNKTQDQQSKMFKMASSSLSSSMLLSSSTSATVATTTTTTTDTTSDKPQIFRIGEFLVIRSDLVNDWPPIWQVEGTEILQKYEPFCQNGKMFYKNTLRYSSYNSDTKKLFIKAPVRIRMQNHTETIVEFMRSELLPGDTDQYIEKIMKDFLKYKDNFEVYLQTLLSQSLDPNFMPEITKERDEYFLTNIKIIDQLMENCKRKLISLTPWTRNIIVSIETFPLCNVITELGQDNYTIQMVCAGCHQPGISVRFLLCGHPYNNQTMETIQPDLRISYEKDMLLCRICAERADMFHKIAHEKHSMFETCSKRVIQEKLKDPNKPSTNILKDIMADCNWIEELFTNLRTSWAEVESLERQKRFLPTSQ